ncbi:MAG: PAS domain-containing sensor histidine kinase [Pirellulaceae bacterium]|nr:MAG: PAS domain-containing sensor histidine kinase [Pirellulaceae bacterium]
MEQQLNRFVAVMETAVDAIITIDSRGRMEMVNPATERMFGYASDELLGRNVSILMPSPYREEHDRYLKTYLRTGVKKIIGIGRQTMGRRKDGTEFPIHLAVSEFHEQGERKFAGIIRDISDLRQAQDELQRLNQELEERVAERTAALERAQELLIAKEKLAMLGQVAGGIAHEIRNPLNVIKTSTFFLLNARTATEEKRHEHLQRIDRQVHLINAVISALADVARMPTPVRRAVALAPLLQSIVATTEMPSSIEVVLEASLAELPCVSVDAEQMTIVFRNIIRNARDAMPQGGMLRIDGHADGESVTVSISDTGIGISSEAAPRIGQPMFTTKARGMGLGLAVSYAIVQRNGAHIDFDSVPGQGTTFRIVFPVES